MVAADGELIWCRSFEVPAQTGAEALLAHVRRLSTITHTNLVPILGAEIVGQEIRVYFEHDGGRSLAEIMPAAGMSAPQAVAIGLSVLSGLQALQTAGFAHGALDARSVQVASYGQIRLIDYGMRPRLIPGGPPAWGDPRRDVSAAGAILCAALGIDAVRPAGTVPGTLERTMPGLAATALTIASGSAGRSASTGLMMLSDGAGRLAARSRVYLSIAELGRLATTQSPALAAAVDAIVNPASPATLPAAGGEATAAQEIEAQEIEAQEIKDQEIKTQEIKAQEIKAQELRAQELRAQELRAQELRA
ncbi:MAG: protein kinase, partial [Candidatus Dormibacteraeota bacterium]|nr:protein kinase [Candidatus Dormibacteraeota bacterium]